MTSFVDSIQPVSRVKQGLHHLFGVIFGTFLLALFSQCAIPLWFTPVPITLQSLAVMLIGALLGGRRGAICILLYLFEGAIGLPFFAQGSAGLATLVGPTGGYFLGFVFAAYSIGWILERKGRARYFINLAAFSLGSLIIYGSGILWLAKFVGISQAILLGFFPFIGGCIVKVVVAAGLIVVKRERNSDLS